MTAGRDPDAAITARAERLANRLNIGTACLNPQCPACLRERALLVEALCAVRDETREECAREVETVSVLTPTMRQSIAKALRAGVGGAG